MSDHTRFRFSKNAKNWTGPKTGTIEYDERRCLQCDGPMPKITPEMRQYAGQHLDEDPYCSADCCKKAHGVKKPQGPALSTTPLHVEPTNGPTRLQQERLARSALAREELRAGKRSFSATCEWCDADIPIVDSMGRSLGPTLRRFCCPEHRKKYHGLYKPVAA